MQTVIIVIVIICIIGAIITWIQENSKVILKVLLTVFGIGGVIALLIFVPAFRVIFGILVGLIIAFLIVFAVNESKRDKIAAAAYNVVYSYIWKYIDGNNSAIASDIIRYCNDSENIMAQISQLVGTEKVKGADTSYEVINCLIKRIQIEYLVESLKDLAQTNGSYTYNDANEWCKQNAVLSTLMNIEDHIRSVTDKMVQSGLLEKKPMSADEMLFVNKMGLGTKMKSTEIKLDYY